MLKNCSIVPLAVQNEFNVDPQLMNDLYPDCPSRGCHLSLLSCLSSLTMMEGRRHRARDNSVTASVERIASFSLPGTVN